MLPLPLSSLLFWLGQTVVLALIVLAGTVCVVGQCLDGLGTSVVSGRSAYLKFWGNCRTCWRDSAYPTESGLVPLVKDIEIFDETVKHHHGFAGEQLIYTFRRINWPTPEASKRPPWYQYKLWQFFGISIKRFGRQIRFFNVLENNRSLNHTGWRLTRIKPVILDPQEGKPTGPPQVDCAPFQISAIQKTIFYRFDRDPRTFGEPTSSQQSEINKNLNYSDNKQPTSEISYPRIAGSDWSVYYDIYGWGIVGSGCVLLWLGLSWIDNRGRIKSGTFVILLGAGVIYFGIFTVGDGMALVFLRAWIVRVTYAI